MLYNRSRTIRATDCRHSSVPGLGSHCVTPRPNTCPTQLLNTCCTIAHVRLEQQIAATPRSPASARTAATDCRHSSVPGLCSHCVTPRPNTCPTQLLNTCTIAHIRLEQQIVATPRSPASARTA
ncbi:hypothetical protein J6590_019913 [Homalodisca vitripennis]|nr:hypothetical protein J6590_019913 [Homalodisca vitripennis]